MPAQTRIANLKHKNDKAFLPLWCRNTWRRNGTKLSCRNLAEIYSPEFSSNFVGWRCIYCVRDFPCRKDTRDHFDERN
jgi:hypothetical protein